MPKLRKQKRRQKFQYNRNRKRMQKSQEKTRRENIVVGCDAMKDEWDRSKTVKQNVEDMGLVFNANDALKSSESTKSALIRKQKKQEKSDEDKKETACTTNVIQKLEEEVAELKEKTGGKFRFTSEQVRWISYMIDKHGDDFKAMARDPKNHYQETPKQIRHKVVKFISIPDHFAPFAKERGLLEDDLLEVKEEEEES